MRPQQKYYLLYSYLLIGMLFFSNSLLGQQSKDRKFEKLVIDGQPFRAVTTSILQDRDGFMWFGTKDGLAKYDGYQLIYFRNDLEDSLSISNSYILSLSEDKLGNIWIGTMNGINKLNRNTSQFERYLDKNHFYVQHLYIDKLGIVWVSTLLNGLIRFDPDTESTTIYMHDAKDSTSISSKAVQEVYEDRLGTLWVGTNKGLNKFDQETGLFERFFYEDNSSGLGYSVTDIYEDKLGNLWIGHNSGLDQFDQKTGLFKRFFYDGDNSLRNNPVGDIYEDKLGVLWIGTWGTGIHLFDQDTEQFTHCQNDAGNPYSINDNIVRSIYEDKSGVIWIGTYSGVNKLVAQKEQFIHSRHMKTDSNSLSDNNVNVFYEDKSGILWVGSNKGLNKFDTVSRSFKRYVNSPTGSNNLRSNSIRSIFEGNQGELFLATYGEGIEIFDPKTEQFKDYEYDVIDSSRFSDKRINKMAEDDSGGVWVGDLYENLNRIDRTNGKIKHFPLESSVWAIYKDSNGVIWVGTAHFGILKYDIASDSLIYYQHDDDDPQSLSSNSVVAICEDSSGALWISTKNGLNKFDMESETFQHYTTKDGLPSNGISSIVEDHHNNFWVSTVEGISKFNPIAETFRNYDVHDGLQDNLFISGSAFVNSTGWIHFGGNNGFTVFHPDSLKDNPHIPPVVITDFFLFHEQVPVITSGDTIEVFSLPRHISKMNQLTLDYTQNVLSFEFSALEYTYSDKNQYAYMMEGFDKDWNYTDATRRFATYTNLESGRYTFRVKGSNSDGVWNETGTSLVITITPSPWKTWWAYTIYCLVSLSTIMSLFYWRIYLLRKRKEELIIQVDNKTKELKDAQVQLIQSEKMASIGQLTAGIAHEVNTPLGAINASSDNISVSYNRLLGNNVEIIKKFNPEQVALLLEFVHFCISSTRFLSSREQRSLRKKHKNALIENNITNDDELAELLTSQNIDTDITELLPLLRNERAIEILKTAELITSIHSNNKNIALAVKKASKTIFALKKFTYHHQNNRKIETNILENINTVLTIYQNQLKKITLETNMEDVGSVLAHPDELGQVWTNLIHNALYAIKDDGIITINLTKTKNRITVAISDNGMGIPEDIRANIFTPFFTTKPIGEGSGLGLDIVKKIIDNHDGEIRFISEENKGTTFEVDLKIN